MKAKPVKREGKTDIPCAPEEADAVWLHCPGPFPNRRIPVILRGERRGTGCWSWNGDTERPTLRPSILSTGHTESGAFRCHSFVSEGRIEFLMDCSHAHRGQTLDLLDVD